MFLFRVGKYYKYYYDDDYTVLCSVVFPRALPLAARGFIGAMWGVPPAPPADRISSAHTRWGPRSAVRKGLFFEGRCYMHETRDREEKPDRCQRGRGS